MSTWPKPPSQRFTQLEWAAIEEALNFRLAGPIQEIDDDDPACPKQRDYEHAHRKVMQRLQ